jgi:DNA-binding CsgD family transcriptional regulator
VARLQQVHPMFERSLAISEIAARLRATAVSDAYGSIGKSAMVFSWKGEILAATAGIDAALNPFAAIRNGRLTAASEARQNELDALLSSVLRIHPVNPTATLGWRDLNDIIIIRAGALLQRTSLYPGCRAALLVDRLKSDVMVPKSVARKLFKLTPAETDLVAMLVGGLSLADCADKLGITWETARTRLKAVLHKTDTTRQSELIMLMTKISTL